MVANNSVTTKLLPSTGEGKSNHSTKIVLIHQLLKQEVLTDIYRLSVGSQWIGHLASPLGKEEFGKFTPENYVARNYGLTFGNCLSY